MPEIGTSKRVNKVIGAATGASSTAELQILDGGSVPAILYIPGTSSYSNRMFKVKAFGKATTGGAYTLVTALYYGVSATVASNTKIAVSTARSISTTTAPWYIESTVLVDSTSQVMQGHQLAMINNLFDTTAALTNAPTAVNLATEGLGFVCTITFGTSHASNAAYLLGFELIPL